MLEFVAVPLLLPLDASLGLSFSCDVVVGLD